jgi:hypothetical protein
MIGRRFTDKRSVVKQALKKTANTFNQDEYWSEDYSELFRPDKAELFKRNAVPAFDWYQRSRSWGRGRGILSAPSVRAGSQRPI